MPSKNINRIMLVGTNSGCGKTTVTCAILKALINKNLKVASFKCGPDYIDPMFHSEIIGAKSRNIDLFLCEEAISKFLFAQNSEDADISVVEGVMGFYDGLSGKSTLNSSCDISNKLGIPAVLVVNCRGMALSVVAMIKGYLDLYPNNIKAVILNNVSKMMYSFYKEIIEENLEIKVLGFMPNEPRASFESRHLGLITAQEINLLQEKIHLLSEIAEESIDLEAFLKIAKEALPLEYLDFKVEKQAEIKIGIAKDKAFCFYYEDSLSLLEKMGAKLISFSPLYDEELPKEIDGLILGGGYPELYLEKLSQNKTMLKSIREKVEKGLPTYAECGGFMYLGKSISFNDKTYPMVGVIDINSQMTNKLQNFGYVTLTSTKNNLWLKKGNTVPAHEFHYSKTDKSGNDLLAKKLSGKAWSGGFVEDSLWAGYPHIHFWGNVDMAKNFINKCKKYSS